MIVALLFFIVFVGTWHFVAKHFHYESFIVRHGSGFMAAAMGLAAVIGIITTISSIGNSEKQEPQPLRINISAQLNSEAANTISTAWPKVIATCPGLTKYSSEMTFEQIYENFGISTDKSAERISVQVKMPTGPTIIPAEYRTYGHTCYFEVSRDGKALLIAKGACQSACLDKETSLGRDMVLPL